jgi:hypothetical protein
MATRAEDLRLASPSSPAADHVGAPRRLRPRRRGRGSTGRPADDRGTRNLVEPAGAAPLAAALRLREQLAGKKVALILSGGNISPDQLRELLAREG